MQSVSRSKVQVVVYQERHDHINGHSTSEKSSFIRRSGDDQISEIHQCQRIGQQCEVAQYDRQAESGSEKLHYQPRSAHNEEQDAKYNTDCVVFDIHEVVSPLFLL